MTKKEAKDQSESPETSVQFVERIKAQWLATVDALVDPLLIINKEYQIIKANKAFAVHSNTPIKEAIGQKCYTLFADQSKPCKNCKLFRNSDDDEFKLSNIGPNQKYFEVNSQTIDLDGLNHYVHIYRDRTEAKKLNEKLAQKEKLASIGLLAGGVAHEINNPLGGILAFSQMLLMEIEKDSPHYESVFEIEQAAQRCKQIIADLLEFARTEKQTESGLKRPQTKCNLKEAFDQAMTFAKMGAKESKIDFHIDWNDEEVTVFADKGKLIQVFLNILNNAVHACQDKGSIKIRLKTGTQGFIALSIKDTGYGMSESTKSKIFNPFFTTKDTGEGTGLGLSICYKMMQDIGGDISVHSTQGHGSTFTLIFPESKSHQSFAG